MIAQCLLRGLSFFWSPSFEGKPKTDSTLPKKILQRQESKRKGCHCKTIKALQSSLSEAQKLGIGVDAVKSLIRTHKATCTKCNTSK